MSFCFKVEKMYLSVLLVGLDLHNLRLSGPVPDFIQANVHLGKCHSFCTISY